MHALPGVRGHTMRAPLSLLHSRLSVAARHAFPLRNVYSLCHCCAVLLACACDRRWTATTARANTIRTITLSVWFIFSLSTGFCRCCVRRACLFCLPSTTWCACAFLPGTDNHKLLRHPACIAYAVLRGVTLRRSLPREPFTSLPPLALRACVLRTWICLSCLAKTTTALLSFLYMHNIYYLCRRTKHTSFTVLCIR